MSHDIQHNSTLTWQQLEPWLLLFHTPGLGAVRFGALLKAFSNAQNTLCASLSSLRDYVPDRIAKRILTASADAYVQACVERDRQWLEADPQLHHILTLVDGDYPPLLRAIHDPPVLIYLNGDPALLNSRQIAVVGSRQPSLQAKEAARQLAINLARMGVVVTSGLAIGIDGAAHQGVIEARGKTIAVLANGVDIHYPQRHTQLAAQIIGHGGALVSEFPLGTQPRSGHFPRRNRIISGLSVGTLVVEASIASGSLITARYALEQGREVFAMPGSVNNPRARGCHRLIRDGARLVESAEQLLEELEGVNTTIKGLDSIRTGAIRPLPQCPEQNRILEVLGYDSCQHDELVLATGFSSQKLSQLLLVMEIEGWIQNSPAGITRIAN